MSGAIKSGILVLRLFVWPLLWSLIMARFDGAQREGSQASHQQLAVQQTVGVYFLHDCNHYHHHVYLLNNKYE